MRDTGVTVCRGLVFAIGSAALTATATNPATLLGIVAALFRRHPRIDENHHILLALRQAYLAALGSLADAFDKDRATDPDRRRQAEADRFSSELRRFIAEALKSFLDGRAIRDHLAKADPGNAGWQRDLAVSHANLGKTYRALGQQTEARRFFESGRTIVADLVGRFPGWVKWEQDLAWFDSMLRASDD